MKLDQKFITAQIPEATFQGVAVNAAGSWVVDSRVIQQGDIFSALPGDRVDGHDFVLQALQRGALGCLVAQSAWVHLAPLVAPFMTKAFFVIVPDTRQALVVLATAWREQFSIPVIGITGSVGKTTTKELLVAIIRRQGLSVVASEGNQNTLIGLSLALLRMQPEHQFAIFEMGINKRGEMDALARMVKPTMGVITALGHGHMEGLGSLTDIAAEKRDIFKYMKADGIGVINGDQPQLGGVAYAHPVIKFGCKMINQVQARQIQQRPGGIHFVLKLYRDRYQVQLASENQSRIYNALAAAAVACFFSIPAETIVASLTTDFSVKSRFQRRHIKGTQSLIIDDSYNAIPESMKAALVAFEHLESSGKKIAVLGDMLELGITAPFWHRQLGRFLRKTPSVHHVVFVGEQMKWAGKAAPLGLSYEHHDTWEQAAVVVRDRVAHEQSVVLVKGSRGMALNKLVDLLAESQEV